MTFGDPTWGADEQTSIHILRRYLEAGGNFIDTANAYTGGRSEELLGRHLGQERDRLVLASKFALSMDPADPNNGGTSRKAIHRHVEESLRRRADHARSQLPARFPAEYGIPGSAGDDQDQRDQS
jgi:aryl-alcohol dehydrogenase-like predicted oxidoreductase